jgi:SAM-dependent methyltransferase
MKYADLSTAVEAWRSGRNVMAALRESFGSSANTDEIVEVAYDLQAGTYSAYVEKNSEQWRSYTAELAEILAPLVGSGATTLDVGTGELTSLAGIAPLAFKSGGAILACDISFSRVRRGLDFVEKHLDGDFIGRIDAFVASMFALPLADAAIDVVWTSHAIEPNGGREFEAVSELLRVAKHWLVLFEPSYENNTAEGRRRMERLGYVRDLPGAVVRAGGEVVERVPIRNAGNSLNPTWALICRPPTRASCEFSSAGEIRWACPATQTQLTRRRNFFFSPASLLAYPVLDRVPMLRAEHGVIASIFK